MKIKDRLFRLACVAIFVSKLYTPFIQASPTKHKHPSWFPKIHCKDLWQTNRSYPFDPKGDEVNYNEWITQIDRKNCYKDWTILIFMAADNDLTPFAFWDIHEMEANTSEESHHQSGSSLRSDILVELDSSTSDQIHRYHVFQNPNGPPYDPSALSKKVFDHWNEAQVTSPLIERLPEEGINNKTDHRLQQFLSWGVQEYPSSYYMVVVWGHGQGWAARQPQGPLKNRHRENSFQPIFSPSISDVNSLFGGIAFDDSQKSFLDIPSLKKVLNTVKEETLEGKPFDVYASDACLMQVIEVAYQISSSTRFIIGSPQIQSYLGFPYREILSELNTCDLENSNLCPSSESETDEAFALASIIPQIFGKSFQGPQSSQGRYDLDAIRTATMSSISTSQLRNKLTRELHFFGKTMKEYLDEFKKSDEDRTFFRKSDFKFALEQIPSYQGGAQEIGTLLNSINQIIANEATLEGELTPAGYALTRQSKRVEEALDSTVVNWFMGTSYSQKFDLEAYEPKAVSIWIPKKYDYKSRIDDFSRSDFYRYSLSEKTKEEKSYWEEWIRTLFDPPADPTAPKPPDKGE